MSMQACLHGPLPVGMKSTEQIFDFVLYFFCIV